jgi:cell division septation protein DedD
MARFPGDHQDQDDLFDQDMLKIIPERFENNQEAHRDRDHALYRLVLPIVLGVIAISAIGVTVKHFFFSDKPHISVSSAPPVIHADDHPVKIRPSDRGGMDVPNQDKLVYGSVRADKLEASEERLLPPPEQPLLPPAEQKRLEQTRNTPSQESQTPNDTVKISKNITVQSSTDSNHDAEQTMPKGSSSPVAPSPQPKMPIIPKAQTQPIQPLTTAIPQQTGLDHKTKDSSPMLVASKNASVKNGHYLVQLAALRTQEEAKESWNNLRKSHQDLLGTLNADIARFDLGPKGIFWRLRTGPFDEAGAHSLCDTLKKHNLACMVVHD